MRTQLSAAKSASNFSATNTASSRTPLRPGTLNCIPQRAQCSSSSSRAQTLRCHDSASNSGKVTKSAQSQNDEKNEAVSSGRRGLMLASAASLAVVNSGKANAALIDLSGADSQTSYWSAVQLPISDETILYDVSILPGSDGKTGFLLGNKSTLLKTEDGGKSWIKRGLPDFGDSLKSDENVAGKDKPITFNSISFNKNGEEGWMISKPPVIFRTTDSGETWSKVPIKSESLPGTIYMVTALDEPGHAEIVTDQGGIYKTENAGQSWSAQVLETVDATLNRTVSSGIEGASYYTGTFSNISRCPSGPSKGAYLGVSSRGNFYMSHFPGAGNWFPRNRQTIRRIQSMGWREDGGIWMLVRGGQLFFSKGSEIIPEGDVEFVESPLRSRGYGILDLGYRTPQEVWATGGSGSLYGSQDNGRNWKRDKKADKFPCNFYSVKFFNNGSTGFVLGNAGVLLRYTP